MAYTIITDVCEGAADCVDVCPIACIFPGSGKNAKGIDDLIVHQIKVGLVE